MPSISRRVFLKRSLAAGVASGAILTGSKNVAAKAKDTDKTVGTMIDLTKCDGCKDLSTPSCVVACSQHNAQHFPEPIENIADYWPQKIHEDWSDKKALTNRLTPYNWTFVQKVQVDGQELNIPRRCMHCNNPPCANLCPFSAIEHTKEGVSRIDPDICFGGAKCRDVCPWGIPARQAGVGLYLKVAPKFAGGGVMYKCDLCYDKISDGDQPACVKACPQGAITYGDKEEMRQVAYEKAQQINGLVYGDKENGGTSTFYVSPVPFEKINEQLIKQKNQQPNPNAPGFPTMPVGVGNFLDTANGLATAVIVAPIAAAIGAGYTAYKTIKGKEERLND